MLKTNGVIPVVDDDKSVCKSLKRLLESMGFQVKTFVSAQEFLNQGRFDDYKCLIVDVRMPVMNGLDLQRQLAASGISIPIVFITAHEDDAVRTRAMEAGALAFLQKPFSDQSLTDAIYLALEQSEAPRP